MIKRIMIIVFIATLLFAYPGTALAGSWLNIDTAGSKRWVDTSHFESYTYWQDTSHWEWQPYNTWVDTSHWEWQPYSAWVDTSHWEWRSYPVWVYWTGYWASYFFDTGFNQWDNLFDRIDWNIYDYTWWWFLWDVSDINDPRPQGWYNVHRNIFPGIRYSTYADIYYGPYYNGDGTYRQLKRTWITNEYGGISYPHEGYYYNLYSTSYGYSTRTYGWRSYWQPTPHWETWWGWFWIPSGYWGTFWHWVWVPSGYWGTFWHWVWVPSGYYATGWRWVTSGYWDEAHGEVSVSKNPAYVFTASHQLAEGEPAHMDLDFSWQMNKKVTKVQVYHELVRYRNLGNLRVDGLKQKLNGLNSLTGEGSYRFEYPKPGTPESKLYIEFTFDNNTGVRVWAPIPVNGYDTSMKVNNSQPVWNKSSQDADTTRF